MVGNGDIIVLTYECGGYSRLLSLTKKSSKRVERVTGEVTGK